MKIKMVLTSLLILLVLSCENVLTSKNPGSLVSNVQKTDIELLTSEADLNYLLSRSNEGVVDWVLSREFAQLALDEFILDGEYPETSILWDIPIGIFDEDGMIRYYEFRIMDQGKTLGAIVGNAREDLGGPISFAFTMDGYSDELDELYSSGVLNSEDIPRIVDNDYPKYAVAKVQKSRSGDVKLGQMYDPETGSEISEVEVVLTAEELMEQNPDFFEEDHKEATKVIIEDYKEEISSLWDMAKANKGNLAGFTFRGKKKSPRKSVDSSRISKTNSYAKTKSGRAKTSYYWCGPTSAGFMLDFIHANGIQTLTNWNKLNYDQRVDTLESHMNVWKPGENAGITWPWELDKGIRAYSSYKLTLALGVIPDTSIKSNLPGINLRGLKKLPGGFHYRNVIAYNRKGWWIFKWSYIKIHDGNNIDGGWETYNPFYHLTSWNLTRK